MIDRPGSEDESARGNPATSNSSVPVAAESTQLAEARLDIREGRLPDHGLCPWSF